MMQYIATLINTVLSLHDHPVDGGDIIPLLNLVLLLGFLLYIVILRMTGKSARRIALEAHSCVSEMISILEDLRKTSVMLRPPDRPLRNTPPPPLESK